MKELTNRQKSYLLHLIEQDETTSVIYKPSIYYWKQNFEIKNILSDRHIYRCPLCGKEHENEKYYGFCSKECFDTQQ